MKIKKIFLIAVLTSFSTMAQVGIGTDSPEGALDVVSTNSGLIFPRVTRTAAVIAPVDGMIVFDLSFFCLKAYVSGEWSECFGQSDAGASDAILGNLSAATTFADLNSILPALTGIDAVYETTYLDYITNNPGDFSTPASRAEVQAMVETVNTAIAASASVLANLSAATTIADLNAILPALTGLVATEVAYQDYITNNPGDFSSPATQAEVQAMLDFLDFNDVIGPNGNIWMDRNLGATRVATSNKDAAAYGDLYQWGRDSDGHESRTSGFIYTTSTTNTPGHADFIRGSNDWRSPQNNNLWQGVNGVNNPCPNGYRVPTNAEISGLGFTDSGSAYNSTLKLPISGARGFDSTSSTNYFYYVGYRGIYWTSTVKNTNGDSFSYFFMFSPYGVENSYDNRAKAFAVRCIKN